MHKADGQVPTVRAARFSVPAQMRAPYGCLSPGQGHQFAQIAQCVETGDSGDQRMATLRPQDGLDETDKFLLEAAPLIRCVCRCNTRVMTGSQASAIGE